MSEMQEETQEKQTQESSEQAKSFDAELLKEEIDEGEFKSPNTDFDQDYERAKSNSESPLDAPKQEEAQNPLASENYSVNASNSGEKKPVDVPEEFVDMAKKIEQG